MFSKMNLDDSHFFLFLPGKITSKCEDSIKDYSTVFTMEFNETVFSINLSNLNNPCKNAKCSTST